MWSCSAARAREIHCRPQSRGPVHGPRYQLWNQHVQLLSACCMPRVLSDHVAPLEPPKRRISCTKGAPAH
eukprot:11848616-Alexandrium_andersonii.AAC.1